MKKINEMGAVIGAGINSAIAGGSFGAGFMCSSGALTAATSFWSGAAIGGGAGFSSGFTTSFLRSRSAISLVVTFLCNTKNIYNDCNVTYGEYWW